MRLQCTKHFSGGVAQSRVANVHLSVPFAACSVAFQVTFGLHHPTNSGKSVDSETGLFGSLVLFIAALGEGCVGAEFPVLWTSFGFCRSDWSEGLKGAPIHSALAFHASDRQPW